MKRTLSDAKIDTDDTKSSDSRLDKNRSKVSVYEEIFSLTNENKKKISEIFSDIKVLEKGKKKYADSFSDPITFAEIKEKYSNNEYESLEEILTDLRVMVDNLNKYFEGVNDKDCLDDLKILSDYVLRIYDEECPKTARRRGRKKKVAKESDSAQASESESDCSSDKAIQTIMFGLIATLKNDETGRFIGPTFLNLPNKSEYPNYYDIIQEPIDLRIIAKKIYLGEYGRISDLVADFSLMTKNARTFNEAKSSIYQDAICVQRCLKAKQQEAEEIPKRKFRGRKRLIDSETSHEILEKFVKALPSEDPLKDYIEEDKPKKVKEEDLESNDEDEEDNSEVDSDDDYPDPVTPSTRRTGGPGRGKRGRGRGFGRTSTTGSRTSSRAKVSDDEASLDSTQVASPTSSTFSRNSPYGSFNWCLEEILSRMESEKDSEENQLCSAFIKLPSKRVYPDYYEDIKRPICIYNIRHKLKKSSYETIQEFMNDIELMVNNAKEYNVEGSKIYEDAIKLLQVAKQRCKELAEQFPDVINLQTIISAPIVPSVPKPPRSLNHPNSPSSFSNATSIMSSQNTSIDLNEDSQSSRPDFGPSPSKRINSGRRPLPPEEARRRRNNNLYNAVWNMTDDDNRPMRDMFITIPSREEYPDYFDIISDPIDLTMIKRKIDQESYKDYIELREDFLLLFRNAKQYNEEGSQIYEDATKLETMVKKKVRSFIAEDQKARVRHEQTEKNRLAFAMQQNQQHFQRPATTPQMVPPLSQPPHPSQLPPGMHPSMAPRMYQQMSPQYNVMGQPMNNLSNTGANMLHIHPQMMAPQHHHHQLPQQQQTISSSSPVIHHPQMIPANMPLVQRMMIEIFYTIKEYKDAYGNSPSANFIKKPNKLEFPQYYKLIRRPIDLCSIAKGILSNAYPDFDSFMNDIQLVFDNACRFYEANSKLYSDAMLLHRVSLAKQASLLIALEASLPPGIAPLHVNVDINIGLRRLLTSLHNTMLTACDPEGRGLVDSLIAGDGTKDSKTSPTAVRLAGLHKAVAAGSYRRLDRLQHDWMIVLRLARIGDEGVPIGEQQRSDAIELTRRWIRLRDDICSKRPPSKHPLPNFSLDQIESYAVPQALTNLIVSSALVSYSLDDLTNELEEEKSKYPLPELDDLTEGKVTNLNPDLQTVNEITLEGKTYKKNDFVFFKSPNTEEESEDRKKDLIGRILEIVSAKEEGEGFELHLARYMRADEAKPSQRRRLFQGEVFRTPQVEVINSAQIVGSAVVLHISKYIKNSVKNVEDSLLNICESHYSKKGQKFIKIIRGDEIPISSHVELVPRANPLIPNRLSPIEPLETALEQVDKTKYEFMNFPTQVKPKSVLSSLETKSEEVKEEDAGDEDQAKIKDPKFEYYDQYVHNNGFHVKLGDYLYVNLNKKANDHNQTSPDPTPKKIMRVERLWKDTSDSNLYFSGPSFISPLAVEHLPTRMFYTKETFISSSPHTTVPLGNTTGKCYIMRPSDYALTRPTEFNEADIFVCESKYFEDEKGIRKLKKGLKKFHLSKDCTEEEFFSIPYIPLRKEPTPQLNSISKEPISDEQMNRNPALAYSVVLQTSAMANEGNTPNKNISEVDLLPNAVQGLPLNQIPMQQQNSFNSPNGQIIPNVSLQMNAGQNPLYGNIEMNGKKSSNDLIKGRKPPSGYVIYAGEQRKIMMKNRPDAQFGDISREVGQKWRQMPASERDIYERKAAHIKKVMEEEDKRAHMQNVMSSPPPQQSASLPAPSPLPMNSQQSMQHQQIAFNHRPIANPYQVSMHNNNHQSNPVPIGQMQVQPFFPDPSHPQNQPQQMIQIVSNQQQGQQILSAGMNHTSGSVNQITYQSVGNPAISSSGQQMTPVQLIQPQQTMLPSQINQNSNSNQHGQPLFVSVPPKACRVLHSEVYQRYIDRLRKQNLQGLSDWRGQISANLEQHVSRNNYQASRSQNQRATLIDIAQKENAIVSNFLSGVQRGSLSTEKVPHLGNKTQVEALWELREYLLNDSLNIQQRCLSLEEM